MTKPAFFRALFYCLLGCFASINAAADSSAQQWRDTDGIVVVVGSPFIELHVQPGRGHARFHAVAKDDRLRLFKSRGGWYKAETEDGKVGWIPADALHTVSDTEGYPLDLTTPSWHEVQKPWQLGLNAGTFSGAEVYTVFSGYRFTPNISAELRYTQAFGVSTNYKLTSLMLLHQPFPEWRISPYFALGAGEMKIFRESVNAISADEKDITISNGVGIIFYLTHNVSVRAEYNHHTILTTAENNEEVDQWTAGFSVLF